VQAGRASRITRVRRKNLRDAMSINHLFLAFMGVVGAAVGIILIVKPETRDYRISPYFWVLLAMALFELLAFARGRGAPGTAVTMDVRVSGFLMAIVLMVVIPIVAGSSARLF
jgi:hypothetical protein